MDFARTPEQQAIAEAVGQLLDRHAGAARAARLAETESADAELGAALAKAGYLEIASGEAGALDAALLVEQVSRAAGTWAIGATALVAPLVATRTVEGPVALVRADDAGPVRYAVGARTLLVLDGGEARRVSLGAGDVSPVRSNFGYPMGRVSADARARGESLGPGSAERLLAAWRLALAAEALGAMEGALRFTVAYLSEREQFGRPIGAFQGVQHRLAECAVAVEGSRWLVYETAAAGAPGEAAALTAGFAADAALQLHQETHQLSGAIGYTTEHDLHVWTMRLQALRLELGGAGAHHRDLAARRWSAA